MMIVTILTTFMTIFEDLTVSTHYAYLTKTQYRKQKNSNDLMFYKITISLVYLSIIILQVRILVFKGVGVRFFKHIKGLKSDQNSIGGTTITLILFIISIQMMFVLAIQFILRPNFTEPEIQGLRAAIPSQIFVTDVLPLIWILTTPRMYKAFKVKLKSISNRCKPHFMDVSIHDNKNDVNEISEEAQNEENIELEVRNVQLFDENCDSEENPDRIDSLHVPSPDPELPELPISNLILSSVAQVSNSSNTLDKENENAILDSQSSTDKMQQQDPSSSTRNKNSKNIVLDRFESARNSMPNVDC